MKKPKRYFFAALRSLLGGVFGKDRPKDRVSLQLKVYPAPDSLPFDASGTRSFTYRVLPDRREWRVRSDRAWGAVTADYGNGRFVMSAREEKTPAAPEPATVTTTAGKAEPLTTPVRRQPGHPVLYVAGDCTATRDGKNDACSWKECTLALGNPRMTSFGEVRAISLSNGRLRAAAAAAVRDAYWIAGKKQRLEIPHAADRIGAGVLCAAFDGPVCWTQTGRRIRREQEYGNGGIVGAAGQVCVTGHYSAEEGDVPCCWRDGERFDLPLAEDTRWFEVRNVRTMKK